MTMTEGVIRPDALSIRDGRLVLAVRLPWYRSLPISCLESVEVSVDGAAVTVGSVGVPGYAGNVEDAGRSDAWWDLRDPLDVTLDAPINVTARPGDVLPLTVDVAVRIPYIEQAPGVPLVQRAVVRTEATVR
jgi:hypothetical protein